MTLTSKEQFLIDHNRLSPANLRVTFELLTKFQQEKKPLLTDEGWSSKMRIPLISWILALPETPPEKKKYSRKSKKLVYKNYPETHYYSKINSK